MVGSCIHPSRSNDKVAISKTWPRSQSEHAMRKLIGDAVTILGEKFTSQHGPRIRARDITRGGDKLTIRDQDGNLRWVMARRSEE
jgi:hypothetical protein